MADEPLPDDLADAVLDGGAVDWPTAEARAAADTRPLLAHLQVVASVARAQRDSPLPPTDRWGHLRLLERIGRGAFGEVYRAWDTRLDREVALKLLPASSSADDLAMSEIIREGRLLARIRHPNVVTIYGAEQIGDRVGLWMEFIHGQTLEQLLQQRTEFSTSDVVHIGAELGRAVSAVHSAGLLHRDIKAQNVMQTADGRVVLMDFGAGRELEDDAADVVGTPLYLAPELFQGKPATVQSDVYSLGVLLFRLATGTYPVRGRSIRDLRAAHVEGRRLSVREAEPKVATDLARMIDEAIDAHPERRTRTAAALVSRLAQRQRRDRFRRRMFAGSVVPLLIVVIAYVAWLNRTKMPAWVTPFVSATLDLRGATESYELGELPEALLRAEKAFRLSIRGLSWDVVSFSEAALGVVYRVTRAHGDLDRAKATYQRLIASARDRADRGSEGMLRCLLATLLFEGGDLSEARAEWAQVHRNWRSDELAQSACSLLGLGDVLLRQAEFSPALKAFQDALASEADRLRFPEDRHEETRALQRVAETALARGDVALARGHADRMIGAARTPFSSPRTRLSASSFMVRLLVVQGDLAAASALMQEVNAHRWVSDSTSPYTPFDVLLTLALVALDDGRLSESRSFAQRALDSGRRGLEPDRQAAAASLLALGWLAEGSLPEARRAIAQTEARLPVTQDRLLRLTGGIAAARVRAASRSAGAVVAARRQLESLIQEAGDLGAVAIQFDARVALGQIEIKAGEVAAGRARLAALRQDAAAKGFVSLAAKAAAAR